jgi:hypothetical protein
MQTGQATIVDLLKAAFPVGTSPAHYSTLYKTVGLIKQSVVGFKSRSGLAGGSQPPPTST